jgi:hypothetical protein
MASTSYSEREEWLSALRVASSVLQIGTPNSALSKSHKNYVKYKMQVEYMPDTGEFFVL